MRSFGSLARQADRLTIAVSAALILGCVDQELDLEPTSLEPMAIDDQEDPVCGMLVRDQSAPRAQLVHRDGSRFFFCSIGDLLVHLSAPSPHGAARAILVEYLEANQDPHVAHTGPHPWIAAADAVYVVGVKRPGIMGEPILVYRDAGSVLQDESGQMLSFEDLQSWWREQLED